jgi:hypothetical protein
MLKTIKAINATTKITCIHQTFNYPVIKTTTTVFLVVATTLVMSVSREAYLLKHSKEKI